MEVRAKRNECKPDAFVHGGFAEIAEAKIELDACERSTAGTHVEHAARRVDADDANAVRRDRDCDPPRADAELDDRATGTARFGEVEGHVLRDGRAPRVVQAGDRVVGAPLWMHRHILVAFGDSPFAGTRALYLLDMASWSREFLFT